MDQENYGIRASSGGGRSSAKATIAKVAAAAIAQKYLSLTHSVEIVAFLSRVGDKYLFPQLYSKAEVNPNFLRLIGNVTRWQVDDNLPVRCPDPETVCSNLFFLIWIQSHPSLAKTCQGPIQNCERLRRLLVILINLLHSGCKFLQSLRGLLVVTSVVLGEESTNLDFEVRGTYVSKYRPQMHGFMLDLSFFPQRIHGYRWIDRRERASQREFGADTRI